MRRPISCRSIASNRIGTETAPEGVAVTFYGSSFIADQTGQMVATASRDREEVLIATFDLDAIAALRRYLGPVPRPAARGLRRARDTGRGGVTPRFEPMSGRSSASKRFVS